MTTTGKGRPRWRALLAASLLTVAASAGDAAISGEGATERLTRLEQAVARIERQLSELRAGSAEPDVRIEELERQIVVLAEEIAKLCDGENRGDDAGAAPYGAGRGLSVGGYGEARYENFDRETDGGAPSRRQDRIDFTRLVLYVGYKFGDRWHFNSEIEYEHAVAGDGEPGELAIEQAYLSYLAHPGLELRTGLLLVPLGFINETHEPPTFTSVNRPLVERFIIPATWREIGGGVAGRTGRLSYRAYLTSSLDAAGFSSEGGLRGGRRSGAEAPAEDLAASGRLDVEAAPGLWIGVAAFAGRTGQGRHAADGTPIRAGLKLWDLHAEWSFRGLRARGLVVSAELDDADLVSDLAGEPVGSEMGGWYLEAAYDVLSLRRTGQQLLPFIRHERFDTLEKVPAAHAAAAAGSERRVTTIGIAYKPIEEIAVKLDHQDPSGPAGSVDQWNLGIGFMF